MYHTTGFTTDQVLELWVLVHTAGLLRCRFCAGHGVDEVVGAAVGASGGAGDVLLTVAAVVADRGVTQGGEHGGAVAGPGLMGVFTWRDVADVVHPIFDVPLPTGPVLQACGWAARAGRETTRYADSRVVLVFMVRV